MLRGARSEAVLLQGEGGVVSVSAPRMQMLGCFLGAEASIILEVAGEL